MTQAWKASWFRDGVGPQASTLWRGVEAQHVVATMRLVDDLKEQEVLEALLESSKPPLPAGASGQHFLLFTPFRYRSPHASRFRAATDPGIWYGGLDVPTACAEVAYWRWRFLRDSEGLSGGALHTEHTIFEAGVEGACVNLLEKPWVASRMAWTHKNDYGHCQSLARACREREVTWIRYQSVRAPEGQCGAVLVPAALSLAEGFRQQTWACKTSDAGAFMRHAASGGALDFPASLWG
ncbi:MAG TPA: RES family NAD+ phosphorylase [Usitatibacteraceae bacterium]|nr:RES family NAD+ phosphorylase [Usitatibacteraceae bacterium]